MPFFSRYTNSLLLLKKERYLVTGSNNFTLGNGSNIFTVPAGVTSISAVAIGGGGSGNGARSTQHAGGGGGGLGYKNNISVTPGQQLIAFSGRGGNSSVTDVSLWATAFYEEAKGQDSFLATLDATITNCVASNTATPITTDVSVNCTSTSGLTAGMTVVVGSGSGSLQNQTTVISVTNSTAFIISSVPIRPLANATLYATSNVIVRGNGGGYPTGFSNTATATSSAYVNYIGGAGGSYLGTGGGSGGSGGNVGYYSSAGSGGGGGGAGGYGGNGGAGGASNGSDASNAQSGTSSSGGGGGGGAGGAWLSTGGYVTVRGGHGGGVGIYGRGANGVGGSHRTNLGYYGQSGTGGSGGGITNNEITISTTFTGTTATNISDSTMRALSSPNFASIKAGWAAHPLFPPTPFNGTSQYVLSVGNTSSAVVTFLYTTTKTNGTANVFYYHMGHVNSKTTGDLDFGAGEAGGGRSGGGRGAVRIVYGNNRQFPSTNVSTD